MEPKENEKKASPGRLAARWKALSEKDKKLFKRLGICLVLGVILMNMRGILSLDEGSGSASADIPAESTSVSVSSEMAEDDLEAQLEYILSEIKGAGEVSVAVHYSESASAVYATENESSESESTEGESTAVSSEESVTIAAIADSPVLIKQELPKIQGVVVVSSGAGEALVRERLYEAVKSLLGVNGTQIAIIEGERSEEP